METQLEKGPGFKPSGVHVKLLLAVSATELDLGASDGLSGWVCLLCFKKIKIKMETEL
jgi:hypothetical protein